MPTKETHLTVWNETQPIGCLVSSRSQAPSEELRRAPRFLRAISWVVLVTFLNLTLQPLAIAASRTTNAETASAPVDDDEKLAKTLEAIEKTLGHLEGKLARGEDDSSERADLKALKEELLRLNDGAMQRFHRATPQGQTAPASDSGAAPQSSTAVSN